MPYEPIAIYQDRLLRSFVESVTIACHGINQIYDLPVDRINKPDFPLPSGSNDRETSVGSESGIRHCRITVGLVGNAMVACIEFCWIHDMGVSRVFHPTFW